MSTNTSSSATDRSDASAIQPDMLGSIDHRVRMAFIYLETIDRRVLSTLTPSITTAQYHALTALSNYQGQSLNALADRLLCDKANASGLIDRLEAMSLAERVRDPADGRRVVLNITPLGQDVLDRAVHARTSTLHHMLERITASERDSLQSALSLLVRLFEEEYSAALE